MFETANGLFIDAGLTEQDRFERMKTAARSIAGISLRQTHSSGEKYRVLGSTERMKVPPEMIRFQLLSVNPNLNLFWERTDQLDRQSLSVETHPS